MTESTAIILIDPYKDFLHPEGKLYPGLAASLAENSTIDHFKQLVATARAYKIPIYYGLHQQHYDGFASGWKHKTELQQAQIDSKSFEEGSWGVEFLEGLEPDVKNGDVIVSKHWSSRCVPISHQSLQTPVKRNFLALSKTPI
jgi:nicotinamidase-related amidase